MATILQDMYSCPLINESLTELRPNEKCDGQSGYNPEGNDVVIPGGVLNAMIKLFLSEEIGIGVSDKGDIYIEMTGNDRDTRVGVMYNPKEKVLRACQFDPSDATTKQALIRSSTSSVPYFAAVPYMVIQRLSDKYGELAGAWNGILCESTKDYLPVIADCVSSRCLIDSFVSGVDNEYPVELGTIENLVLVPGEVYDYTPELLEGKEGSFILTQGVERPKDKDPFSVEGEKTYQEQMQALRDEMFPLVKDFYENLSEEDKALVPDEEKLGIYIPTRKFKNVVRIIADGLKNGERDTMNVLLKGPPGVGKSTMAVAIAYVFSMPYRFTQSYKTADASEYIGTTVADNGVLKTNVETQFAQTVMRGGVHMDDDNNYAAEGEGTVKNSILIAPYTIKLADGTMAKRHQFSIFMMSANPDAKGSRPINEAYKDRFCAILDLERLSQDEMVRMVRERSRFEDEATIVRMVEAWEKINNDIAETGETADMLSPRSLVNWAKQTRILGDVIEAADYNLLGALCASEDYKANVLDNIIRPLLGRRG